MRYMLILIGDEGTNNELELSPDDAHALMEPWDRFGKEIAAAGVYVAGEGLQPSPSATTIRHATGGERVVSDGPFAETKEQVGGFYLIECDNLDEALDWAKKVPVREGNSVELRPVMDYTKFGYEDPAQTAAAS